MLIRLPRSFLRYSKKKKRVDSLMHGQKSRQIGDEIAQSNLTAPILTSHPNTQAIYLYGTWGTEYQRPDSDLDIAVLLPHDEAKQVDPWEWILLAAGIAGDIHVEHADLINLRTAPVILCKEVIAADRRVYCADENAADQFEMLTLSFYQKLNDERREIVESGLSSGRFYDV